MPKGDPGGTNVLWALEKATVYLSLPMTKGTHKHFLAHTGDIWGKCPFIEQFYGYFSIDLH